MALTNAEARKLVSEALRAGRTLTIECAAGAMTVGPIFEAVRGRVGFAAYLYGRGRFAAPSGREIARDSFAPYVAATVVEYAGCGAAAKAVREVG